MAPQKDVNVHDRSLAAQYDERYYAQYSHAGDSPYRPDEPVWQQFFGEIARQIAAQLQPRAALDAGCAMGMLVAALRDRGVDAWGVDISQYAIEQVRPDIRPYCRVGSLVEDLGREYDLITCIEVLEHLPAEDADRVVANFAQHADCVLLSSTPDDYREPTHLNVQPTDYWVGLFARHGLYRDLDFEAYFVSPQAMLFRRALGLPVSTLRAYERRLWQTRVETLELRTSYQAAKAAEARLERDLQEQMLTSAIPASESALDALSITPDDPAWRLFVGLIGARRRFAPDASLRGRLVRLALKAVADGMDSVYSRVTARRLEPTVVASAADPAASNDGEAVASSPPSTTPRGNVDGPPAGTLVRRLVLLWGWAIDAASTAGPGIRAVRVHIDGVLKGTATYGVARHDVQDHFGEEFLHSGWRFALDVAGLTPGPHMVQVTALSAVSGVDTIYAHAITVPPSTPPPLSRKLALFVSGCAGGPMHYRCDHQAEQLRLLGGTADVAVYGEVDLGDALERYHFFVLQRVPLAEDVEWLQDQARARDLPVLYDVDDFIFDEAAARHMAGVERFSERQQEQLLDCVARTRQALLASDAALVSTTALATLVSTAVGHDRVRVVPNVVSDRMQRQASTAANGRRVPAESGLNGSARVTIGYLSGTPTHDRDFKEAADALIWALDTYPGTRLVAVGPVVLDARFERFGPRVERWPLRPWQQLPAVLASIDINIAPLEADDAFTDAKSCIKYLEAALVGVPTIASPRSDFRRAITPGVNGLLADSPAEWRVALERLITSPELRHTIGRAARDDLHRHHTTAATARASWATLGELVGQPVEDEPLAINWVVRGPVEDQPGGSSAAVSALATYLNRRGHNVRLCVQPRAGGRDVWVDQLPDNVARFVGLTTFPPADVSIATDASTARLVSEAGLSPVAAYFIEETSGRAVETAGKLPLRLICFGTDTRDQVARLTKRPTDLVESDAGGVTSGQQLERILHGLCIVREAPTHPGRATLS